MRRGVVLALACLAGCSWSAGPSTGPRSVERLPAPTSTTTTVNAGTTTTTAPSATEQECKEHGWETASYRPDGAGGAFVDELRERGYVNVGVDESTLGFSARDPSTGHIEGFEVEIARAVGRALFGEEAGDGAVKLVPLVTSEKRSAVTDGLVDMTISAVSMDCARWEEVDFSAEYFTAHQQFLVRRDSPIHERADLAGRRVCVTAKSSSKDIMEERAPEAEIVEAPARADCLVKLQEGDVDAYFGHDSFLYGMLDPTLDIRTDVLPVNGTVSHYGIAIAKGHEDLVRFVNGVLEQMHADGSWDALHEQLQTTLADLPDATQPTPEYRDEP